MKPVYIFDTIRTPIGNFGGSLSNIRADDLAAHPIKELIKRNNKTDWEHVEDVILGCANQAGEDNRNVARMALLLADLPFSIGGETINRLCSSGLAATINAYRAISMGDGDLFITGGIEHMTRGPWVISKVSKAFGRDAQMHDSSFGWRFINPIMEKVYGTDGMGQTAENLVDLYNISREDQDLFAYNSQMKAARANENGRLSKEISSITIPQKKKEDIIFLKDEFIKPHTTIEKLNSLRTAFRKENGSVTAGNSSGLNDGSAALLIGNEYAAKKNSLTPMVKILGAAVAGVEPRIMGIGPVEATKKVLRRTGLLLDQMDIIEINEAFSAQSLACIRALKLEDNDPRINPNGGAIAIGHPLGMTGARLLQTAAIELKEQNKKYALVTMCIGVGQGYAAIIERP
ncbi:acetyl-CoA C-acyltransferase [Bacteroidota bacterium]|nr:acetyl-CoA C-acyltransferase [Bacteroidota bacterium]|tara:strand:+ start:1900 stop:3108 length:1209 start_codon:yes stop_codon:yes gene_type:complete